MPWRETSVMEERIRFVALALERKQPLAELCRSFGISRTTGYNWLRRYQEEQSFTALTDRSRAPHQHPNATDPAIVERVVALRLQYGWGAKKLRVLLEREGIDLACITVNRILKRQGLLRRADAHQPALTRFERQRPNELWQMDFKGPFTVQEGRCHVLSLLDDHSRYAVGLFPLPSTAAHPTYTCLVETFRRYGLPEEMLMDHGIPWWNPNSFSGLSWLAVQLIKQGIELHFSRFRHPQTQGKVEALHRTIQRAFDHHGLPPSQAEAVAFFQHLWPEYNDLRPHEALGQEVPAQHYQPSQRAYQETPPAWVYELGLIVETLNSQGSLSYHGRRYFVAKPLANEQVAYEERDGKLLVHYRHMYVREIDLRTADTRPFIRPVRDNPYV